MSSRAKRLWCGLLVASAFHIASVGQAEHRELAIEGVPQRGAKLCWAAVSQMAINHLESTEPSVTQGELAAYQLWKKLSPEAIAVANNDPDFKADVAACRVTPNARCDQRGNALLLGLDYDSTTNGPLPRSDLIAQLRSDRPVLLEWHFAEHSSTRPVFGHYVSVIGFDSNTDEFLIWDPWPFERQTSFDRGKHKKWITYDEYQDPHLAMGAGVSHVSEIFNLEKRADVPFDLRVVANVQPVSLPIPPPVSLRPVPPVSIRTTTFRNALAATTPLSKNAKALKRKPSIRGVASEVGSRTAGEPLPIVVLSPSDLKPKAIDVEKLLRPITRAVLYPVIADKQVVDAYLATMGPKGWEERGYASTEVTRRLEEQRARLDGSSNDMYVLAVPAWGTFFLAQGFGSAAKLTPIATTTFSEAGRTVSATSMLEKMASDLQTVERRTPDLIPARPL